ncbi:unnamed protein product [Cuscuta campestris]|uniref:Uncharacterized protein n=1 Tax=Cuscuta campestris TaxID=132261 RepID=A0A484LWX9_9ASTE|nr:unnamed protein product [Cuscuta campestris]
MEKEKLFDEAVMMILRSASLSFRASGHFGMTRPVSWRGNPEFAAMAARAFRFVTLRSRSEPHRLGNSCSVKIGLGVGMILTRILARQLLLFV